MKNKQVAVVHEWFVDHSGSEKVVEQILKVFPHADIFSVVEFLPENLKYFVQNKKVKTTFIQKLPFAKKKYRSYLPLMPFAIEQLDLSGYDIIISSNHAVAKGVLTRSNQIHFCYCHSPMRYAWDLYHQYMEESKVGYGLKGLLTRWVLHKIRQWDVIASYRVDHFIANSSYVAKRIKRNYNRSADVIYPPVAIDSFKCVEKKEDYYVTLSRLVQYKKVDVIVEAFNKLPDKKLIVLGDGPDKGKLKKLAGPNIEFKGFVEQEEINSYVSRAKAFVYSADEDFGITPVEAQACGTPVIAYGKGGVLETVIEGQTGLFYEKQSATYLASAIKEFEEMHKKFDPKFIHIHAQQFSEERFKQEMFEYVDEKLSEKERAEKFVPDFFDK